MNIVVFFVTLLHWLLLFVYFFPILLNNLYYISNFMFDLKVYNINTVAKKIELPGAYLLGAGASSHNSVGMNAEVGESRLAFTVCMLCKASFTLHFHMHFDA